MAETTPKLRFRGFSDKWRSLRLDEIATIQRGRFSPRPRNNPIYYGGDIPFVQTSDVVQANGRLRSYSQTLNELGLGNSKLFEKGSILITIAANIGYAAVLEIDMACPDSLVGLVPFKTNNSLFICYRLEIEQPRMDYLAVEAAQKNINIEFLKPYKFNIPSLPEQQRIANFLSMVDKKVQALTRKKELLEEYKKGVMQKIFSQEIRFKKEDGSDYVEWEEKKLGQLLDLLTDFEANGSFADVKANVEVVNSKDYAWYVRATDLENNSPLNSVKYVTEKSYNFLKKTKLSGGELLVSKRGEIGKLYYYHPKESINATVAPNLYLLKLNKSVLPFYLYNYFKNESGNKKLRRINASSTIGALYKDDVKAIRLFIPSIEEQTKIAAFFSSLDEKIDTVGNQLKLMQKWKKGLLQKMFV